MKGSLNNIKSVFITMPAESDDNLMNGRSRSGQGAEQSGKFNQKK